jgi:hypothetical protein
MEPTAEQTVARLRVGLLTLAALIAFGLAVELAMERHWTKPTQWIAWVALVGILASAAMVRWWRSARAREIARALALLVVISAALGVIQHVAGNYDAAPLDFRYSDTWDGLPESTRWWLAISKSVGPSPVLAPGALAVAGFCVLLATSVPKAVEPRGQ